MNSHTVVMAIVTAAAGVGWVAPRVVVAQTAGAQGEPRSQG